MRRMEYNEEPQLRKNEEKTQKREKRGKGCTTKERADRTRMGNIYGVARVEREREPEREREIYIDR